MNYYLDRFSVRETLLDEPVPDDLNMVVVIPCYNEENLEASLRSLYNCDEAVCSVEVITVINAPNGANSEKLDQNKLAKKQVEKWNARALDGRGGIRFYSIEENQLPIKDAGVGLARKIGMDEAVRRLEKAGNPDGVIVCFDADASCATNYLVEIEKHFGKYPKTPACSIHFEHPVQGNEFSLRQYDGIVQYETHLRYYKNALKFCNLPYAYHTVGSSMAVRSNAYQKQNGMNKRKAGEDFYFLQKLIPLGNFSEIKTTMVTPSPRISTRVPFGTGRAMYEWIDGSEVELLTYHYQSFLDLKQFCGVLPRFYEEDAVPLPKSVEAFLGTLAFSDNLKKIRRNSTSEPHFVTSFYKWFNAFKVLKYVHYSRDKFYPDVPVFEAANKLLELVNMGREENQMNLLRKYRDIDRL